MPRRHRQIRDAAREPGRLALGRHADDRACCACAFATPPAPGRAAARPRPSSGSAPQHGLPDGGVRAGSSRRRAVLRAVGRASRIFVAHVRRRARHASSAIRSSSALPSDRLAGSFGLARAPTARLFANFGAARPCSARARRRHVVHRRTTFSRFGQAPRHSRYVDPDGVVWFGWPQRNSCASTLHARRRRRRGVLRRWCAGSPPTRTDCCSRGSGAPAGAARCRPSTTRCASSSPRRRSSTRPRPSTRRRLDGLDDDWSAWTARRGATSPISASATTASACAPATSPGR